MTSEQKLKTILDLINDKYDRSESAMKKAKADLDCYARPSKDKKDEYLFWSTRFTVFRMLKAEIDHKINS